MKQAVRFPLLCFASASLLSVGLAAVDIYVRGLFDEKWGTRSDNLMLAAQLALITAGAQSVVVLALAASLAVKRIRLGGWGELAGVLAFACVTAWWWPPASRHPVLSAGAIAVLSVAVAWAVGRLAGGEARATSSTVDGRPL